jgi:ubiquinone/menaquinone biosynthesis C-methylase UbiE
MSANAYARPAEYALATGAGAVVRLEVLHRIYSAAGRKFLVKAGLTPGMEVADFGCGPGTTTRMLASLVGPSGKVTGIDLHRPQLDQAARICSEQSVPNTIFVDADACRTGLPSESFDVVYTRFLLLHLADPAACLEEMWRVLKPEGILVIEDGDIASAGSVPPTALNMFADLFCRLAPLRGVDYSVSNRLAQLVADAGFSQISLNVHQPAERAGLSGLLLLLSVQEAASSFVEAGLITKGELDATLRDMERAIANPEVLALAPRMSLVSARKRVN